MAKQALAPNDKAPVSSSSAGSADEATADKPAVSLVTEKPQRRGRPAAGRKAPSRKAPAKKAATDILFLVETEEDSGRFETQKVASVAELLDLLDDNRKVITTREWREF